MKARYSLLLLVALILAGCKTMQFSSQPVSDAEISPLKTFAVTPAGGSLNLFTVAEPEGIRSKTRDAIIKQLNKKGYQAVAIDASPDFIVNSAWMLSTTNNPEYQLNGGTYETAQQIPATEQVASLDVTVISGDDGQNLWRNSSPWPFSVRYATLADFENAATWVFSDFPTQEAKLAQPVGE